MTAVFTGRKYGPCLRPVNTVGVYRPLGATLRGRNCAEFLGHLAASILGGHRGEDGNEQA